LATPEEESEEGEQEEVEDKLPFLDALKGLQVSRHYMFQIDVSDNIMIINKELVNEIHRLTVKEKKKQTTHAGLLNKQILEIIKFLALVSQYH
jgi:hypothetical protein